MDANITLALQAIIDLVGAGAQIATILQGKDKLTEADIQAIIDAQDAAHAKLRGTLQALIDTPDQPAADVPPAS